MLSASVAMGVPGALRLPVELRGVTGSVQALSKDIIGADWASLVHAPSNLPASQKAFLDKYQPLSEKALSAISPVDNGAFSKAGSCFAEYPCFSVERGAVATIGDKQEVTRDQVSAILDHLTSSPTAVIDQSNSDTMFSSLKVTKNQATLQVIAAPGTIQSDILAGMVFDMFKLQSEDPATNAIRAVKAKTDGKERPFFALCLYPEGADKTQEAYNFCIGNQLDGTPTLAPPKRSQDKRFSFEGGVSMLCSFIKIPLLCHEES
jgi:hypothetical protein